MVEIDPKYEGKIARMRNLKMYADKSDEDIYLAIKKKEAEKEYKEPSSNFDLTYTQRYKKLIDKLQSEYGVDMNESNDAESLKMLVKHTLQLESLDVQIRHIQEQKQLSNEDTRTLKNLADVQRSLVTSITELQTTLGVSRKTRKEKQVDDIPQFIAKLKSKSEDYWNRETLPIKCDKCKIELARIWRNFKNAPMIITIEAQCPNCKESIVYVK